MKHVAFRRLLPIAFSIAAILPIFATGCSAASDEGEDGASSSQSSALTGTLIERSRPPQGSTVAFTGVYRLRNRDGAQCLSAPNGFGDCVDPVPDAQAIAIYEDKGKYVMCQPGTIRNIPDLKYCADYTSGKVDDTSFMGLGYKVEYSSGWAYRGIYEVQAPGGEVGDYIMCNRWIRIPATVATCALWKSTDQNTIVWEQTALAKKLPTDAAMVVDFPPVSRITAQPFPYYSPNDFSLNLNGQYLTKAKGRVRISHSLGDGGKQINRGWEPLYVGR